jgi:hypothetical protein
MRVATLDIEGWTHTGERIPFVSQSDCSLNESLDAFRRLHPNAEVLRVTVTFADRETVPVRTTGKPVTLCVAIL